MDTSKVIGVTLMSDEPLLIRQIDMEIVKKIIEIIDKKIIAKGSNYYFDIENVCSRIGLGVPVRFNYMLTLRTPHM